MAVVVVMVSSTLFGGAAVDSGFIHPLLCGAGNGGGNGYKASESCKGQAPCGPVACGLSLVVYMKIHTGFIVFVCGLQPITPHLVVHTRFMDC